MLNVEVANAANKKPEDFVISTGKSYTVRKFVEESFKYVGINIKWKGKGLKEIGYDFLKSKKILVKIDPVYFRPYDSHEDIDQSKKKILWLETKNFL